MLRYLQEVWQSLLKEVPKTKVKFKRSKTNSFDITKGKTSINPEILAPNVGNEKYDIENSKEIIKLKKSYEMLMKKFVNPRLDLLYPGIKRLQQMKLLQSNQYQEILGTQVTNAVDKQSIRPVLPTNSEVENLEPSSFEENSSGWSGQPTKKHDLSPKPEISSIPCDIASAFFIFPELDDLANNKTKQQSKSYKRLFTKTNYKKQNKHRISHNRFEKSVQLIKEIPKLHISKFYNIKTQNKELHKQQSIENSKKLHNSNTTVAVCVQESDKNENLISNNITNFPDTKNILKEKIISEGSRKNSIPPLNLFKKSSEVKSSDELKNNLQSDCTLKHNVNEMEKKPFEAINSNKNYSATQSNENCNFVKMSPPVHSYEDTINTVKIDKNVMLGSEKKCCPSNNKHKANTEQKQSETTKFNAQSSTQKSMGNTNAVNKLIKNVDNLCGIEDFTKDDKYKTSLQSNTRRELCPLTVVKEKELKNTATIKTEIKAYDPSLKSEEIKKVSRSSGTVNLNKINKIKVTDNICKKGDEKVDIFKEDERSKEIKTSITQSSSNQNISDKLKCANISIVIPKTSLASLKKSTVCHNSTPLSTNYEKIINVAVVSNTLNSELKKANTLNSGNNKPQTHLKKEINVTNNNINDLKKNILDTKSVRQLNLKGEQNKNDVKYLNSKIRTHELSTLPKLKSLKTISNENQINNHNINVSLQKNSNSNNSIKLIRPELNCSDSKSSVITSDTKPSEPYKRNKNAYWILLSNKTPTKQDFLHDPSNNSTMINMNVIHHQNQSKSFSKPLSKIQNHPPIKDKISRSTTKIVYNVKNTTRKKHKTLLKSINKIPVSNNKLSSTKEVLHGSACEMVTDESINDPKNTLSIERQLSLGTTIVPLVNEITREPTNTVKTGKITDIKPIKYSQCQHKDFQKSSQNSNISGLPRNSDSFTSKGNSNTVITNDSSNENDKKETNILNSREVASFSTVKSINPTKPESKNIKVSKVQPINKHIHTIKTVEESKKITEAVVQNNYLKFVKNKAWYFDHYLKQKISQCSLNTDTEACDKIHTKNECNINIGSNKKNQLTKMRSKVNITIDVSGKDKLSKGKKSATTFKKHNTTKNILKSKKLFKHLKKHRNDNILLNKSQKHQMFLRKIYPVVKSPIKRTQIVKIGEDSKKLRQNKEILECVNEHCLPHSIVVYNPPNINENNNIHNHFSELPKEPKYTLNKFYKSSSVRKPKVKDMCEKKCQESRSIGFNKLSYDKEINSVQSCDTITNSNIIQRCEKNIDKEGSSFVDKVNYQASNIDVLNYSKKNIYQNKRFIERKNDNFNSKISLSDNARKLHSRKQESKLFHLKMYGAVKNIKESSVPDMQSLKSVKVLYKTVQKKHLPHVDSVNSSFKKSYFENSKNGSNKMNSLIFPVKLQTRNLFTAEDKSTMMVNYLLKRYATTSINQFKSSNCGIQEDQSSRLCQVEPVNDISKMIIRRPVNAKSLKQTGYKIKLSTDKGLNKNRVHHTEIVNNIMTAKNAILMKDDYIKRTNLNINNGRDGNIEVEKSREKGEFEHLPHDDSISKKRDYKIEVLYNREEVNNKHIPPNDKLENENKDKLIPVRHNDYVIIPPKLLCSPCNINMQNSENPNINIAKVIPLRKEELKGGNSNISEPKHVKSNKSLIAKRYPDEKIRKSISFNQQEVTLNSNQNTLNADGIEVTSAEKTKTNKSSSLKSLTHTGKLDINCKEILPPESLRNNYLNCQKSLNSRTNFECLQKDVCSSPIEELQTKPQKWKSKNDRLNGWTLRKRNVESVSLQSKKKTHIKVNASQSSPPITNLLQRNADQNKHNVLSKNVNENNITNKQSINNIDSKTLQNNITTSSPREELPGNLKKLNKKHLPMHNLNKADNSYIEEANCSQTSNLLLSDSSPSILKRNEMNVNSSCFHEQKSVSESLDSQRFIQKGIKLLTAQKIPEICSDKNSEGLKKKLNNPETCGALKTLSLSNVRQGLNSLNNYIPLKKEDSFGIETIPHKGITVESKENKSKIKSNTTDNSEEIIKPLSTKKVVSTIAPTSILSPSGINTNNIISTEHQEVNNYTQFQDTKCYAQKEIESQFGKKPAGKKVCNIKPVEHLPKEVPLACVISKGPSISHLKLNNLIKNKPTSTEVEKHSLQSQKNKCYLQKENGREVEKKTYNNNLNKCITFENKIKRSSISSTHSNISPISLNSAVNHFISNGTKNITESMEKHCKLENSIVNCKTEQNNLETKLNSFGSLGVSKHLQSKIVSPIINSSNEYKKTEGLTFNPLETVTSKSGTKKTQFNIKLNSLKPVKTPLKKVNLSITGTMNNKKTMVKRMDTKIDNSSLKQGNKNVTNKILKCNKINDLVDSSGKTCQPSATKIENNLLNTKDKKLIKPVTNQLESSQIKSNNLYKSKSSTNHLDRSNTFLSKLTLKNKPLLVAKTSKATNKLDENQKTFYKHKPIINSSEDRLIQEKECFSKNVDYGINKNSRTLHEGLLRSMQLTKSMQILVPKDPLVNKRQMAMIRPNKEVPNILKEMPLTELQSPVDHKRVFLTPCEIKQMKCKINMNANVETKNTNSNNNDKTHKNVNINDQVYKQQETKKKVEPLVHPIEKEKYGIEFPSKAGSPTPKNPLYNINSPKTEHVCQRISEPKLSYKVTAENSKNIRLNSKPGKIRYIRANKIRSWKPKKSVTFIK